MNNYCYIIVYLPVLNACCNISFEIFCVPRRHKLCFEGLFVQCNGIFIQTRFKTQITKICGRIPVFRLVYMDNNMLL